MNDFITDNTAAVFAYADQHGLVPDFVKQSNVITKEDVKDLPDIVFADQVNRLYPCHTKEATVLSAIYHKAAMEDNPVVWDTIQKRAAAFEVQHEVDAIASHFEELVTGYEKQASQNEPEVMEKFALTITDGDKSHNFYDISTKQDTLIAMDEVNRDFASGNIQLPWMRKIASSIMEAARQFGVADNATGALTKYAQVRLPDVSKANALISTRNNDKETYDFIMRKLASDLVAANSFDEAINAADDAAALIYSLDKKAGVEYSDMQLDPYDIIFSGPSFEEFEKHASTHVYISDIAVPVEDILNVSDTRINQVFSKNASAVITDALQPLREGNVTSDTTNECHVKLASLDPAVRLKLLEVLANTGF